MRANFGFILRVALLTGLALGCFGCAEEPERIVGATTEDGRFEVELEATRDWVRPGNSLPIRVRVKSLRGKLEQPLAAELVFVVNGGDVDPRSLFVEFAGMADSLSFGAETLYEEWVTFEAEDRVGAEVQGEIHALFLDARATLKIRLTPPYEEE
ncbi:MAG: hypothetical protein HOC74_25705 [Gemmatimonadetes bacterium]|jgi:hypothetical protein|nr:hypothetical protein [Gemmatimonadota bacterium]